MRSRLASTQADVNIFQTFYPFQQITPPAALCRAVFSAIRRSLLICYAAQYCRRTRHAQAFVARTFCRTLAAVVL